MREGFQGASEGKTSQETAPLVQQRQWQKELLWPSEVHWEKPCNTWELFAELSIKKKKKGVLLSPSPPCPRKKKKRKYSLTAESHWEDSEETRHILGSNPSEIFLQGSPCCTCCF